MFTWRCFYSNEETRSVSQPEVGLSSHSAHNYLNESGRPWDEQRSQLSVQASELITIQGAQRCAAFKDFFKMRYKGKQRLFWVWIIDRWFIISAELHCGVHLNSPKRHNIWQLGCVEGITETHRKKKNILTLATLIGNSHSCFITHTFSNSFALGAPLLEADRGPGAS